MSNLTLLSFSLIFIYSFYMFKFTYSFNLIFSPGKNAGSPLYGHPSHLNASPK